MKITAVKSFPVWAGHRNLFVLKIESDDGCYGYGEAGLSGRELAVRGAVDHFCRFLVGQDPRRIGALWQRVYRSQYFEGGRVLTAALSAIDIALHDLVARSLGVPVYQLLGGKQRDRVPCFVTTTTQPGPGVVEEVQRLVAAGWTCIRTGIGYPKVEPNRTRATAAPIRCSSRAFRWRTPPSGSSRCARRWAGAWRTWHRLPPPAVGGRGGLVLPVDAGRHARLPGGTDPRRDAGGVRGAAADDPGADGDRRGVCQQVAVPALPGTRHHRLRAASIICNVGGFTEAMKVVGLCEAHYIDLMPHNPLGPVSTAACIHLAAATPLFAWLEERSPEQGFHFDPELFPVQPKLDGVTHRVPDTPGLGVEFNEEAPAVKKAFEFWENPHLSRRDGSHTNW